MARLYSEDNNDATLDDEDYYLAPQSQRAFGAGLKRKRVAFVPASSTTESTIDLQPSKSSQPGAKYLSIVLGRAEQDGETNASEPLNRDASTKNPSSPTAKDSITSSNEKSTAPCPTCHALLPLHATALELQAHESSIAHQLHQDHSHPPSHLDRQRKGLKYLQEYGWDPDARVGLGARSEGIRAPIKAREKRDTAGLGLFTREGDEEDGGSTVRKERKELQGQERVKGSGTRMSAKEMKKVEEERKKKNEKLWNAFYGEDLSRYLGPDG